MHRRAGDGAVISEQRLAPQAAQVARRPDTDAAPLTALSEATDGPGLSNVKLRGSQENGADAADVAASKMVTIFNRASCCPSQMPCSQQFNL